MLKTPYWLPLPLLLVAPQALALVPPEYKEPEDRLDAEVELGLQFTSGNSESSNFNGRGKLVYDADAAKHETVLKAYFASDNQSTTAEQYTLEYQLDYKLGGSNYIYGRSELLWDKFGSFTRQQIYSAGYGSTLVDRRHTKLSLEVGGGYRYNEPNLTDADQGGRRSTDEGIARFSGKFSQRLHEYTTFNTEGAVETGNRNTVATLKMSIRNQLWADLALKIGTDLKFTDRVPENSERTDIISTVNLLYTF
ncbi:DUF481 domain-containing protein [Ferrimonas sediminicola]|uniref:DUF481 domain-containing protein n=1 Tax=Ferrimonas sediminicola TaxID=2569538 RepID=A0A4U1BJ05_9GAMM|nr:DUF481 domain-containing protein [Ferrimonas sediminicola]TKB51389.1 DUF481 domain-containing protein [Ferrimonas sediminicola]